VNMIEQQIECKTCQWNKLCIEPPTMTKEEVEEKTKPPELTKDDKGEGKLMGSMMSALFFAGRDKECTACSVFIDKLRSEPELSTKIKELMQSY